jgi:hypothetical protein
MTTAKALESTIRPLEKAAEGYQRMARNEAWFRMVIVME